MIHAIYVLGLLLLIPFYLVGVWLSKAAFMYLREGSTYNPQSRKQRVRSNRIMLIVSMLFPYILAILVLLSIASIGLIDRLRGYKEMESQF